MDVYQNLKKLWKKLGFKGHVVNYSSQSLWVMEGNDGVATAHLLPPLTQSPPNVNIDGFRRMDEKPIEMHKSWWKIYDGSTIEIFDKGSEIVTSKTKRTAVTDKEFTDKKIIYNSSRKWPIPIKVINDVRRNKKKKVISYHIPGTGWVRIDVALKLTCKGEIANARPVFPRNGNPYLRTRRDQEILNNLEVKG